MMGGTPFYTRNRGAVTGRRVPVTAAPPFIR